MEALKECCRKHRDCAALPIRIVFGLFFVVHGYMKISTMPGFSDMLAGLGFPMPGPLAWIVSLVELLGGLALLAGLCVELAGLLLTIVMLVAIFTVTGSMGFLAPGGYGVNLLVIAGLLSVMMSGAGKCSLESKMCGNSGSTSMKSSAKTSASKKKRR